MADQPLPGDSTQRCKVPVEVELRALVPNYESLPESEETRYRPIVEGYGQLEVEARQQGIWLDVLEESTRTGAHTIIDPHDRLLAIDEIYKRLRRVLQA